MRRIKNQLSSVILLLAISTISPLSFAADDGKYEIVTQDKTYTLAAPEEALVLLANSFSLRDISPITELLDRHWQDNFSAALIDILSLQGRGNAAQKIISLLEKRTAQNFNYDINAWYYWLWNQPESISANYATFKANLYRQIDPKFNQYFSERQAQARIRLDEIRWGGVVQDGIPPLRYPKMLAAADADYLQADNIVFGIEINGDARAYPKRILAWHEMFVDTIGGVNIAGVYCTLCGTVIPYKTSLNGKNHALGTSGFLYRSNKLMYDKQTQSLWSTVKGEPVVGPLVDKGIALEHLGVVTTTWGEWQRRHPQTKVLSLNTGHRRNYAEGAAYSAYFATDKLMFNTPFSDTRLKNKQEVLALRFFASPKEQLAIDTAFLNKHPLYKNNVGRQKILVLTDTSGANRVYDPKDIDFVSYDQNSTLIDSKGQHWQVEEHKLTAINSKVQLTSLPYRRAFWFGWHAAFPQTKLIK